MKKARGKKNGRERKNMGKYRRNKKERSQKTRMRRTITEKHKNINS